MFKMLKRLLGWETDDESESEFYAAQKVDGRPGSATGHLFSKTPANPKQLGSGRRPVHQPKKHAAPPKVEKPTEPAFDPYNTGKFDRSASWERISKNQR